MSKTLLGFDYRLGHSVERSRKEWQALMAQTIAAGGHRRVADGETFIHGKDARIIAEIYSNVAEAA